MFPKFHGISLANGSFIENLHVERLAADPTPATAGRIWINTTTKQLKFSGLDNGGAVVVHAFSTAADIAALDLSGKAYTDAAITSLKGVAPEVLDTLGEISAALNNDPDLYNTLVTLMTQKVTDAKEEIRGEASEAFDTLKELEDGLAAEIAARGTAITGLDNRLTTVEGQASGKIGDLASLTTDEKSNLVAAINEVDGNANAANSAAATAQAAADVAQAAAVAAQGTADQAVSDAAAAQVAADAAQVAADAAAAAGTTAVGDLASLTTEAKTNVVAAVNEVAAEAATAQAAADAAQSTADTGVINAATAQAAADANGAKIGTLASLTTEAKTDLVAAINELDAAAAASDAALRNDLNARVFTYASAEPALVHTVTHGLTSEFVQVTVLVKGDDGKFRNDIVAVEETSSNVLTIGMTESRDVKVVVQSVAAL